MTFSTGSVSPHQYYLARLVFSARLGSGGTETSQGPQTHSECQSTASSRHPRFSTLASYEIAQPVAPLHGRRRAALTLITLSRRIFYRIVFVQAGRGILDRRESLSILGRKIQQTSRWWSGHVGIILRRHIPRKFPPNSCHTCQLSSVPRVHVT